MNVVSNKTAAITPEDWAKLLEKSANTQIGKDSVHQYVVLKKTGEYELKNSTPAVGKKESAETVQYKKLSIAEIQEISKKQIEALEKSYEQGPLTAVKVREFEELVSKIYSATNTMVEARNAKRDQPLKRILRAAAIVASFGLLLLRKSEVDKEKKDWNEIVDGFRSQIDKLQEAKKTRDIELLKQLGFPLDSDKSSDTASVSDLMTVKEKIPVLIDRLHNLNFQMQYVKDLEKKKELEEKLAGFKTELVSYIKDIKATQTKYQTDFQTASELTALVKVDKCKEEDVELLFSKKYPFRSSPQEIKNLLSIKKGQIPYLLARTHSLFDKIDKMKGWKDEDVAYKDAYEASRKTIAQLKSYMDEIKSFQEKNKVFLQAEQTLDRKAKAALLKDMNYSSGSIKEILDIAEEKERIPVLLDELYLLRLQIEDADKSERAALVERSHLKKAELKSYFDEVQSAQKQDNFNLNFSSASKFIALKQEFVENRMPEFQNRNYEEIIKGDIELAVINRLKEGTHDLAIVNQFEKDIPRSNTFLRIDKAQNISDKQPIPSPHSTAKVVEGFNSLSQLVAINPEKNIRWLPILQLSATQISLNAIFRGPIEALVGDCAEVTWQEEGHDFVLKAKFPESLPPENLEINRNSDGEIVSVNVAIKGQLDLVKHQLTFEKKDGENIDSEQNGKVVFEKILEAEVCYTITLDENKKLTISILKKDYRTSIKKAR